MNIALAPSEISQFLEKRPAALQVLWAKQELNRSLFTENRTTAELANSSIFDVLEFYLRRDIVGADGTESDVEAWLTATEELVENTDWHSPDFEDMAAMLMEFYLDFSGTPVEATELSTRTTKVLVAYFALIGFVQEEQRRDSPRAHLTLV